MRYEIYIMTLLLVLLVGCEKNYAPPYNTQQCDAMLDTLEAIEHHDNAAALRAARELKNRNFAEEITLFIRYSQQAESVRGYLSKGDFQSLRSYIREKQLSGEASDDLLALSTLPDDLQALAVFCSRMPWESSQALKDALTSLRAHTTLLSQYESFRTFHDEQLKTLKKLEQSETQKSIIHELFGLDDAVACNDTNRTQTAVQQLSRYNIDYQVYKISMLNGKNQGLKHPDLYAIALADAWARLTPSQRKRLVQQMPPSHTLCHQLVTALNTPSNKRYADVLMEYRRRKLEPPSFLVVQYMRSLPPLRIKSSTPLPGFHIIY